MFGVKDPSAVSPDTWTLDLASLHRPGNKDAQLDLLFDYQNNLTLYEHDLAYDDGDRLAMAAELLSGNAAWRSGGNNSAVQGAWKTQDNRNARKFRFPARSSRHIGRPPAG